MRGLGLKSECLPKQPSWHACGDTSDLTFIKEAAHGIPLQKMRILGHTVHVGYRVVQIKHVLRGLFVSMNHRGVVHPENLQKSLYSSWADFLGLCRGSERVLRVVERHGSGRAQQCGEADDKLQHICRWVNSRWAKSSICELRGVTVGSLKADFYIKCPRFLSSTARPSVNSSKDAIWSQM